MGRSDPRQRQGYADRKLRHPFLGQGAVRTRNVLGMLAAACCCRVAAVAAGASFDPQEVLADAPSDLSVTVYRSPYRNSGSIDLDYLWGFALVRETRLVRLPAGVSRVRFEGVADGIEPAS